MRIIGNGQGGGNGQLDRPYAVAVWPRARPGGHVLLFVADSRNHRISVFDAVTGAFVRTIAGPASSRAVGQLSCPSGVTVHAGVGDSVLVFVTEEGNHRVQVFVI